MRAQPVLDVTADGRNSGESLEVRGENLGELPLGQQGEHSLPTAKISALRPFTEINKEIHSHQYKSTDPSAGIDKLFECSKPKLNNFKNCHVSYVSSEKCSFNVNSLYVKAERTRLDKFTNLNRVQESLNGWSKREGVSVRMASIGSSPFGFGSQSATLLEAETVSFIRFKCLGPRTPSVGGDLYVPQVALGEMGDVYTVPGLYKMDGDKSALITVENGSDQAVLLKAGERISLESTKEKLIGFSTKKNLVERVDNKLAAMKIEEDPEDVNLPELTEEQSS
ncbi:MAG: hypothetical protein GY696_07425, partial [Gammaproteobacteria bacterium]|nr:hypothetical protein [Gammaproteobacteria bacterium]